MKLLLSANGVSLVLWQTITLTDTGIFVSGPIYTPFDATKKMMILY